MIEELLPPPVASAEAFDDSAHAPLFPEEEQIVPAQLNLAMIYIPGTARDRLVYWARDEEGYSEQN